MDNWIIIFLSWDWSILYVCGTRRETISVCWPRLDHSIKYGNTFHVYAVDDTLEIRDSPNNVILITMELISQLMCSESDGVSP